MRDTPPSRGVPCLLSQREGWPLFRNRFLDRVHDANSAVRLFVELTEAFESAPGAAIFDRTVRCGRCGTGLKTTRGTGRKERTVCASCNASWDEAEVLFFIKERGGLRKKHGKLEVRDDVMYEAARALGLLRPALRECPERSTHKQWRFDVVCLLLYLDPHRAGTYQRVQAFLEEHDEHHEIEAIRDGAKRARRVIQKRLEASGVVEPRGLSPSMREALEEALGPPKRPSSADREET